MSESPRKTINAVIFEIGVSTPVTNAEWGRMFADALMDSFDDDAVRYALSDAGEMYRSKALSEARSKARSAVASAVKSNGANGTADIAMHQQLGFEISFEGFAPRPLVDVTHEILIECLAYIERQKQGVLKNEAFVRQAANLTAPFPGELIRDLIASGRLSADDFAAIADVA